MSLEKTYNADLSIDYAKADNPNNYDFSKILYTYRGCNEDVTITCPKHGDFVVTYDYLLSGGGTCPYCKEEKLASLGKLITKEIISYCPVDNKS